jgi:hypothetical protein
MAIAAPRMARAATNPAAANTDAQHEQVAAAFADELLYAVDFKLALRDGVTGSLANFYFANLRPEWRKAVNDAVSEEVDAARPSLDAIIGRQLAKEMSLEELQAGLVTMRDPAMAATMKANHGRPASSATLAPLQPEAQRAASSPAGQSLSRKMDRFDEMIAPVKADLVFAVMPGVLRRFGDKTAALEAKQRTAAR